MAVIEKSTAKERVLFKRWMRGHVCSQAWIQFVNRFQSAENEDLHKEIGGASIDDFLPTVPAENFLSSAFIFGKEGEAEFNYWTHLHHSWQERLRQYRISEEGQASC